MHMRDTRRDTGDTQEAQEEGTMWGTMCTVDMLLRPMEGKQAKSARHQGWPQAGELSISSLLPPKSTWQGPPFIYFVEQRC